MLDYRRIATPLAVLAAALLCAGAPVAVAHDTTHSAGVTDVARPAAAAAADPAASSAGVTSAPTRLSAQDRRFADQAARAGMEEVAAGRIAQQDANSADVRRFAGRMVHDHAEANERLRMIARRDGFALPARMDAAAQHEVGRLETAGPGHFDPDYMKHQASDHRQVIEAFRSEADHGRNPDLKHFAAETLPTLREHLQLARSTVRALPAADQAAIREPSGIEAARAGTGASAAASEKSEHMPVPKTGM
jgi:putative membrane protein